MGQSQLSASVRRAASSVNDFNLPLSTYVPCMTPLRVEKVLHKSKPHQKLKEEKKKKKKEEEGGEEEEKEAIASQLLCRDLTGCAFGFVISDQAGRKAAGQGRCRQHHYSPNAQPQPPPNCQACPHQARSTSFLSIVPFLIAEEKTRIAQLTVFVEEEGRENTSYVPGCHQLDAVVCEVLSSTQCLAPTAVPLNLPQSHQTSHNATHLPGCNHLNLVLSEVSPDQAWY
eukprot:1158433-Pelagomonas_calceolata.AAC.19